MREVTKNGQTFRVAEIPDTSYDFWSWFEDGSWEPGTFDVIDRFLSPTSTFVDIGAWVGPMSLYASRLCEKVFAFEPDPVAFDLLDMNLSLNDVTNVWANRMAVGDKVGVGTLSQWDHWGSSMSSLIGPEDGGKSVHTTTLSKILEGVNNVALVKMDIEGGEALALPGHLELLKERQIPLHLGFHEPRMSHEQMMDVKRALSIFPRLTRSDGANISPMQLMGYVDVLCEWT